MPKQNFRVLLIALLLYILCSGLTLRDRILIHSLHLVEQNALVEPSSKRLFEGAMSGMIRQLFPLHDDYSGYIPYTNQKEFEGSLDNRYDGIGIIYGLGTTKDDPPEVIYPLLRSPAFEAGLQSGDRILNVAGQSTPSLTFREVSELFKGKVDTDVELTIQRFGQSEPIRFSVKREPLRRDSVEGDGIDENGNRIFHLSSHPDIGYVRITSFSDRTALEVREALQKLDAAPIKGLILDLRDNPGGYVATSVQIANFFVKPTEEQNVIVSTRYRDGTTKSVHKAHETGYLFEKPMIVLIDGETASAAEILSACLQDYRRATIVGQRSFGKGVVQEIFVLPLKSGTISLSDASYWRPSQKNINRSWNAEESDEWGVTPDPERIVTVSKRQRDAQIQIRDRRSNAICDDKERYMAEFLERLLNDMNSKPSSPSAHAPEDEQEEPFLEWETEDEESDDDFGMENEKDAEKLKSEKNEPFVLQGNAPYFDPQLDRAVELLENL